MLEQSELLKSEDNSPAARLKRQTAVVLLGAVEGYLGAACDRLSNHKLEMASELGVSAALSYGLVRAANGLPPVRYAAAVSGAALSFSFVKNVLSELPQSFAQLKDISKDSWDREDTFESNKTKLGKLFGPVLFDASVVLAGGMVGGRFAKKHVSEQAVLSSMQDKFGKQIDESVFTAQSSAVNGKQYYGSAYAVESDKLATAFHVVKDEASRPWTMMRNGESMQANVLAAHPYFDLALFKVASGKPLTPLPLASLSERNTALGVIVGSPGAKGIEMRPARFREGLLPYGIEYNTVNGRESVNSLLASVHGGSGRPGMSGGPALIETGEVVGTLSTLYPAGKLVGVTTLSVPSHALRSFLKLVERPQYSPKDAAAKLKISEEAVLKKLHDGQLAGFLVPSSKNQWQWRVSLPEN